MNVNQAFPSKHLKADDLGDALPVLTIEKVVVEKVGEDNKPVVYFRGKKKGLALNITNKNSIVGITGSPETDDWRGKQICLYATETDYQGKRVACIRVEDPPFQSRQRQPEPPPPIEVDDDLPF